MRNEVVEDVIDKSDEKNNELKEERQKLMIELASLNPKSRKLVKIKKDDNDDDDYNNDRNEIKFEKRKEIINKRIYPFYK